MVGRKRYKKYALPCIKGIPKPSSLFTVRRLKFSNFFHNLAEKTVAQLSYWIRFPKVRYFNMYTGKV